MNTGVLLMSGASALAAILLYRAVVKLRSAQGLVAWRLLLAPSSLLAVLFLNAAIPEVVIRGVAGTHWDEQPKRLQRLSPEQQRTLEMQNRHIGQLEMQQLETNRSVAAGVLLAAVVAVVIGLRDSAPGKSGPQM